MKQQHGPTPVEPAELEDHPAPTNVDPRLPPRRSRTRKPQSAGPGGGRHRPQDLAALLSAALDQPTVIVEDGKRRRGSKRERIAAQLVARSADADLRATKLLLDLMRNLTAGAPEAELLDEADEKVIATFLARLGMAE